MTSRSKPIVVVTGAAGAIGSALSRALTPRYTVVGFDLKRSEATDDWVEFDLTSDASVELAFRKYRDRYGKRIDSIVHLAAYFDFTGEDHPLYEKVNVEGTRRLVRALQDFDVGQLVYSGTILVHEPASLGERIDEDTPIAPKWVYPKSKVKSEELIQKEHGPIPYVLLRLAGLYDERTAVPTLSQQIARIYKRDLKSHLYSGDIRAGQSMVHMEDAVDAICRTIDRRESLPGETSILIGEPDPVGYDRLQDMIGRLVHGAEEWETFEVPKPVAKTGAWVEEKAEPVIPDAIDQGEKPFIRPFMVDLADDHYALDIRRARELLGWEPKHEISGMLPKIVQALKDDPLGWYEANGVTPPPWLESATEKVDDPEALRAEHEKNYRSEHRRTLWAPFLNVAVGSWLITAPPILGYEGTLLGWSDVVSGLAVVVLASLSLSWRLAWARWACAGIGIWLLFAPLVFWTPSAAGYLNDTLAGALVIGFAILAGPTPGISPAAALTGPTIPPGCDLNPSSWLQRLPIIALAFVGLYISRYLAAYQLGHTETAWDPFFTGAEGETGTETVITSEVSEAWPVSDAGLGGVVYMLEILVGLAGSTQRWRTMPWLVMVFGIMIVPLGVVSITFIIIQPILIGTWCTLCLVAAAAMLLQIMYFLNEAVASGEFLWRRNRAGKNVLRVLFVGDTDEADERGPERGFDQPIGGIIKDVVCGGVGLPWNLALCILIGVSLMLTRLTLGAEGGMANADHLIGSLVVTVSVIACAEVARPLRFVNMLFGLALLVTPFAYGVDWLATVYSIVCGLLLVLLSIRRGPVKNAYGEWSRFIV